MSGSKDTARVSVLILTALCCGCRCADGVQEVRTGESPPAHDREKEMQVKEQLFRYVIRSRAWVRVWFIDYGDGRDPPEGFLDRLQDLPVTLRGISLLKGVRPAKVRDPQSGKEAWIACAKIVRWLDDLTVEVEFGSYHAPESSGGGTGLMEFVDGNWVFRSLRGRNS